MNQPGEPDSWRRTVDRKGFASAIRGSSILFASMMVVNVLNYGYALVLGRWLGPQQYGAYASFISLFLLVTLLPLTLQQIGARYAAKGNSVMVYTRNLALGSGGVLGLLIVIFSQPLSGSLNLPTMWLAGLGLLLPLYGLIGALRGEAQGEKDFTRLGSNLILEHVGKILLTPLAFLVLPSATGAVLATLAALPLTLVNIWRYLKRRVVDVTIRREVLLFAAPVLVNLAAQAVIINSDVLLVNAFNHDVDAGIYAAVAIIGRVVFYGSWAVSAAVFPVVAARFQAGKPHRPLLWGALGAVLLVSGSASLVCALFPNMVIGLLFGQAYLDGARLIGLYAFMTTLYALANIVSNHFLALGIHRAGYLQAFGAILQVALIFFFHDSLVQIIWMQIWAKSSLLVLSLLAALVGWLDPKEVKGVV